MKMYGMKRKQRAYGSKNPERKQARMGRMMYGQGGHASIEDMEKQCMIKADYNESLKSKD
tara:strand:+ start:589 stop:768 length:180 start_codon:yes stop_codon:yes gene_type:complete